MLKRCVGAVAALAFLAVMAVRVDAQVVIDHSTGFTGQTDLTLNLNAALNGANLRLTSATNGQLGTGFSTALVNVANFRTTFVFHTLGTAGSLADGMGFCIQRVGPTAIGSGGGGMGYAGILTSVFIKLDNYDNESSTGLYQNGANPATGSVNMRPNVDLHSLHDFRVDMDYNGTVLEMIVTDLTTNLSFTTTFTVNIPTVIGGGTAHVGFTGATGGLNANQEVLTWVYGQLPRPTVLAAVNGPNRVSLSWNPSAGAVSYVILRRAAGSGAAFVQVTGGSTTGTTFIDTTASNPNSYEYVVQAVNGPLNSFNSNQVVGTPVAPEVTALPNTGLQTNENLASTTFTIQYNLPAPVGNSTLTVMSSDISEGVITTPPGATPILPAGTGFTMTVAQGTSPTIIVTVTGVDDSLVDNAILYTVTVTATGFPGLMIPDLQLTNNDNDVAGITFNRTAGLVTSENLATDSFTVVLNRQPFGDVTIMSLTSSNPQEGVVSVGSLTFTDGSIPGDPNAWNVPHVVTVTGVDDPVLDFTVGYSVVPGAFQFADGRDDTAFTAAGVTAPTVSCINLDNETIPVLPTVWGGGSGGGCGLLGLEGALPFLLLGLLRRRRAA